MMSGNILALGKAQDPATQGDVLGDLATFAPLHSAPYWQVKAQRLHAM